MTIGFSRTEIRQQRNFLSSPFFAVKLGWPAERVEYRPKECSRFTYLLHGAESFFDKLTNSQLVMKFPAFHGTRNFITAFTIPPSVPILSQLDPVYAPNSHFLKTHLMLKLNLHIICAISQKIYIFTLEF